MVITLHAVVVLCSVVDRWFSRLNGFKLVILGPFIVCCSVWAKAPCWTVHWPIMIYFFKIFIWMESCLIGTHTTSSYIYLSIYNPACGCSSVTAIKVFSDLALFNVFNIFFRLDHFSSQTYRWGSFHVLIWTMVLFRWTLKFVDKVIHENHENWYPTNKNTFTVVS